MVPKEGPKTAVAFFDKQVVQLLAEVRANVDRLVGLGMGVCEDRELQDIHDKLFSIETRLPSVRDMLAQSPPAQIVRPDFPLPDRTSRG
jgi:hypothetical protein